MKNLILFPIFGIFCTFSLHAQLLANQVLDIGEKLIFQSEVLSEERILNVYLPESYNRESKAKAYPVIYLLDGSYTEDFLHVLGITQFESYPWINEIPEMIVVGIENVDRKRDFTFPTTIEKDKIDFPTTGGSAKFIEFLEKELQPLIEQRYNTSCERILIGQSLGGLLATEILIKKPQLFTHYLIVSPSIWWNAQSLFELEFSIPKDIQVHVAVGKEHKMMIKDAKKLYSKLKKSGLTKSPSFNYYKNKDHADVLHIAVEEGLPKFIFSRNI